MRGRGAAAMPHLQQERRHVEASTELDDMTMERAAETTSSRRRTVNFSGNLILMLSMFLLFPSKCQAHHNNNNYATSSSKSNKATLTIFDFTSWSYRAEIANFGSIAGDNENQASQNFFMENGPKAYHSTLMVPSTNHSQFCEIPETLLREYERMEHHAENTTRRAESIIHNSNRLSHATTPWRFPGSVSLLVSLGACHPLEKVKVALWLHEHISRDLKFIVFYNNDPNDPDQIVTLDFSVFPEDWNGGSLFNETNSTYQDFQHSLRESGMIFVSVSTGTGTSLLGRMDRLAKQTNTSPEFANPSVLNEFGEYTNSRQWHMPMVLEKVLSDRFRPPTYTSNNNSDDNSGGNRYDANDSFYWFRFVLFTLLIVSPCLRAAYLWWAGGGRIRLRRDSETNRIVGFQYTPPMQNWFGMHGSNEDNYDGAAPVHDRLTEEQVMALPEIVYHCSGDEKATVNGDEDDCDAPVQVESESGISDVKTTEGLVTGKEDKKSTTMVTLDAEKVIQEEIPPLSDVAEAKGTDLGAATMSSSYDSTTDSTDENLDVPLEVPQIPSKVTDVNADATGEAAMEVLDEEQPPEGDIVSSQPPLGPYTATKCVTCSICIDEFDDGERIRLLPRCGHAFHTECILPWLVERQGCCPLCKVSVLETEQQESESGENTSGNGPSPTLTTEDGIPISPW